MSRWSVGDFSNQAFLEAAIARDKDALSALIDAYSDHLYKASLGMGLNSENSKEVCHNTWATFIEVVARFEGRSHIRTFLFGIFYRKVAEFRREDFKFNQHESIEDVMENRFLADGHWNIRHEDPSGIIEKGEWLETLEKCMEKLSTLKKAVFNLKILQEEDTQNICNILGVSDTNLRQLLFRAKNEIRECLNRCLNDKGEGVE